MLSRVLKQKCHETGALARGARKEMPRGAVAQQKWVKRAMQLCKRSGQERHGGRVSGAQAGQRATRGRARVHISGNDVSGRASSRHSVLLLLHPSPPSPCVHHYLPWRPTDCARSSRKSRKMRCSISSTASSTSVLAPRTMIAMPILDPLAQRDNYRHTRTCRQANCAAVSAILGRVLRSGPRGSQTCVCGL